MASADTNRRLLAVVAASTFFVSVGLSIVVTSLSGLVAIAYCIASMGTFVTYFVDKSAAIKGRRRISENTLHLLTLLGGWPGALVAQQVFRHKTVKKRFRFFFWLTVVLNLSFFLWLHTPEARALVDGLLVRYLELTDGYRFIMPSM